jgi:hypothetical protein
VSPSRDVGIRWTIGDVDPRGFEALRLAVWGAWRSFGPDAAYAICVNSIPVRAARRQTAELPCAVEWIEVDGSLPPWLVPHVDPENLIEGKVWKFHPLQLFPDRWEISLDNDCIFWEMPPSIRRWLKAGDRERCLIEADVTMAHGQFARLAGEEPRNTGIRGVPPGFPLEAEIRALLRENPVVMSSELDEQGLQVAAVGRRSPPEVVTVDEVSICSPFPPHLPHLGECGAHFVGLNERSLPWAYYGRPATEWIAEHWQRQRPELYRQVGIAPAEPEPAPESGEAHVA